MAALVTKKPLDLPILWIVWPEEVWPSILQAGPHLEVKIYLVGIKENY